MPPKRRGSQTASSSTWTELFQRIAPTVLQDAVQATSVIREIPAVAITAVQYVTKSTSTTTTNAAVSQKKTNKDSKMNNNNKKGDVSALSKSSDKYDREKDSVRFCQGDADVKNTSTTTTNPKDEAASQKKPIKKDRKINNNKKGDVSALSTNSDNYDREKDSVRCCQGDADVKNTSTTTTSPKDAAASQKIPIKKDSKMNNNKKGDVSALGTNSDNYNGQKDCARFCQGDADVKSTTTITTNPKDEAANQKTNKKDSKMNKNKKGDVSALSTNSDNCDHEKDCAICCQGDADDLNDTDHLGTSFVHVELEDNIKCNTSQSINAVIKGLPNHVTEDQVLKELAEEHFYPITVLRKISCKEYCESNEFFFLVQVPKFIESRLLILRKLLGYKVEVQKQDFESTMVEFTECKTIDHGKTYYLGSNSIADLGYNSVTSNNSHSSNESIHKPDIFSSSGNSIPNSQSVKEECDQSSELVPKETYIEDTSKLLRELREIKKEVEQIRFELKINVAKKVNSDFLHVILQGIPPEIKNEDIVNDLKSKQFSVNTVYRLGNENNKATDEVVFELPKAEDHIFYFSCCLGYEVQVEEYKDDFSYLKYNHASFKTFNADISLNKPINILFRGIPRDISENNILRDLKEKRFHPIAIHRMVLSQRYLLGKSKHVVLVQVPLEEEHIYELSCILGYPVTVEGVDKGTLNVAQCKTCMQFGHKANICSGKTTSEVVPNIPDQKIKITNDIPRLNAVIKGVPIEFDDEMVNSHLIKNWFNPIAIHRMTVNQEILPTYLVQVPEREKRILILTCFLGFSVKVEEFLPHLYPIEQCQKCSQFGHWAEDCPDCPIVIPDSKVKNIAENILDNKKFFNESISDFDNSEKIEAKNIKKESTLTAPIFTSLNSNLAQSHCLEQQQQLMDKLDNLEVVLKNFISKNNEKDEKLCSCSIVSKISTNDTSTNTDNTYEQLGEMEQAIKSYENISIQFLKNMGLFAQAFMGLDKNVEDISNVFEAYRKLKDLTGGTTSFVEAMIRILKSTIIIMLDIPTLPGVTINTINEQLHLLEELKNIKMNMGGSPAPFTKEYDVNFPKLQ